MLNVDVVIVSWAADEKLKKVTSDAIESLLNSEKKIKFNIFVIESAKEVFYDFPNTQTIHTEEPFGYNRYLNLGRKKGNSDYVVLCNNDLVFENGWASAIIEAMKEDPKLLSASPFSPGFHDAKERKNQFQGLNKKINYGYRIQRYVCGWCIFQQRKIYDIIGDLDENFEFHYCDNDYSEMLNEYGIKHALILESRVKHLLSKTLNSRNISHKQRGHLTGKDQTTIFNKKWR